MRTTLDIPQDIFEEAQAILGYKSKTDVVIHSLREIIRRKKLEEFANLAGKIEFKVSAKELRGKPSK